MMKNEYAKWELATGSEHALKLKLFVAGASPNSVRAIANVTQFVNNHLKGTYTLEIIDIHQQPMLAQSEQIIALPVLIKLNPGPVRRLVGDMSNTNRMIAGLDLVPVNQI
ncbi:MAG: circadian clock KaiB family protein [Daejeonella sp.]